jgi:tRNA-specific 2-thiouridylase
MVKRKVLVGLSGGVDSALTAYILKKSGYEVKGIHLLLHDNYEAEKEKNQAIINAEKIGIELELLDLRELFMSKVIAPFVGLYLDGKTPNPCIYCNYYVKYGALLDLVKKMDYDYLSLGHYAEIVYDEEIKQHMLKKSKNSRKDQSYLLHGIRKEDLGKILLPMSAYYNKIEVKKDIEAIIPELCKKKESKNICFIGNRNYQAFIYKKTGMKAKRGFIKDEKGNVLGKHKGIINYTLGQKRGIKEHIHMDYVVVGIDSIRNEIIIGPEEKLYTSEIVVRDFNFIAETYIDSDKLKVRTSQWGHEIDCKIEMIANNRVYVKTFAGIRAPVEGQAAVIYMEDIVVGGGIIDCVWRS